jgi:hypothetical protein
VRLQRRFGTKSQAFEKLENAPAPNSCQGESRSRVRPANPGGSVRRLLVTRSTKCLLPSPKGNKALRVCNFSGTSRNGVFQQNPSLPDLHGNSSRVCNWRQGMGKVKIARILGVGVGVSVTQRVLA